MYYEDLEMGMGATGNKTITNEDIIKFIDITGDDQPLHTDEEYAKTTRFGTRVVHGMLTASLVSGVLGTKLPGPGCILISSSFSFANPVKIGDTVDITVTVRGFHPTRKNIVMFNISLDVDNKPVIAGTASVWVPSKP